MTPQTQRRSGILMHISSLPSPYGIGTLGKEAYEFIDFLKESGMNIWQVLPIGPTSYGDSPYQSFSTFAGNPYFIDFDMLKDEGILQAKDYQHLKRDIHQRYVDYEYLYKSRYTVLRAAYAFSYEELKEEVEAFKRQNKWLNEYALFSALKDHFGGRAWSEWPEQEIRFRTIDSLHRYFEELKEEIRFYEFVQYLFFKQWFALKKYANKNDVKIFGDMPIYVAMDSADTWAHPDAFLLDKELKPVSVAGVPPDYFTEDGQLWGNPLYDWEGLKKTSYKWWIQRMQAMFSLYDIIRIDHFIGFANYYSVPADEKTARNGVWKNGPGRDFFHVLRKSLPGMPIVAEDLGVVTRKVKSLLKYCGFPGMKVLLLAFDTKDNTASINGIVENSFLYTGTHDNDTVKGWWEKSSSSQRDFVGNFFMSSIDEDICKSMIEMAYGSIANTVIIPMQDLLGLGSEARMNIPGTVGDNWKWRMTSEQLTPELKDYIKLMNQKYNRGRNI